MALASAQSILQDINSPALLESIPTRSPEKTHLFGKIITTRREFDEKYGEIDTREAESQTWKN